MPQEWVAQQKKVFTKWVNMHLSKKELKVENITEDFHDGIALCALMELLSNKPLPHKPSTKTTTQYMRVQNLNIGFKLIKDEGIKLVGVGSEDLEAKNEKMILGLMWTLIQFYQISNKKSSDSDSPRRNVSSKEVLMAWVKAHLQSIPGLAIKDFHQSWQDGVAFCHLVNRAVPDSIDLNALRNGNRIDTLNLAFDVAEAELGIPKLLDAEDIASSDRPDEQSIMTYVSLFPERFEEMGIITPELFPETDKQPAPVPEPTPAPPVVVEDPRIKELERLIELLRQQLADAEERERQARDQMNTRDQANEKLKHDIEALANVENDVKIKEEELTKMRAQLDSLRSQDSTLSEALQTEKQTRDSLLIEVTTLQDMLRMEAERQASAAAEKEKKLQEECDRLAREKEHEQLMVQTVRRESNAEIVLANERERALKEQIERLEKEKAEGHKLVERVRRDSNAELTASAERERSLREIVSRLEKEKESENEIIERVRRDSSAEIVLVTEREKLLREQLEKLEREKGEELLAVERVRRDSIAELTRFSERERELKVMCEKLEEEKKEEVLRGERTRRDSDAKVDTLSKELTQLRAELKHKADQKPNETPNKTRARSGSDAQELGMKPLNSISLFGIQNRRRKYSAASQSMLLHEATKAGDLEMVTHLLEGGFPVDSKDAKGNTPLHIVCELGNAEGVVFLLSYKADPHATNDNGDVPLHLAAKSGSVPTVNNILPKSNINARNNVGATPLSTACEHNRVEVVKVLLGAKANVTQVRKDTGVSPLHDICAHGNVEIAELLVQAGAEVECVSSKGWTPLFCAAANGHTAVVEMLHTKYNANINKFDYQMTTPLFHCITKKHIDTAQYLLQQGADVNAGKEDGWRPIHAAVFNDDVKMCEMLLQYLPNLNVQCRELNMYTPLQLAIASQTPVPALITLLLKAGSSTNIIASNGSTALHIAAHYGHAEVVRMLVKDGARLDIKNARGKSPVQIAANYGYKEIVGYLAHKQGIKEPSLKDKKPVFKNCSSPAIITVK